MNKKLTKRFVDYLPLSKIRVTYWDTDLKGFGLRIGATTKTYIAETKISGKTARVSIGKHGVFTPEQARAEARHLLGLMARDINPNDLKNEKRVKGITLLEVFEDYLKARKTLKPNTLNDYRKCISTYFRDWQKKAILDITKDMVGKKHTALGKRSEAQANLAMRILRALFNFAAAQYEDSRGQSLILENPVRRLSQTRAWYRIERRQTVIKPYELTPWLQAVNNLKNDHTSKHRETIRDYLLLVLFTGLRKEEAARMTWANVDLQGKTLTIPDTKNHLDHTLPLSSFLYDLLWRRKNNAVNEYVFPGASGTGYIVEQRKQMVRVIQESGVSFTIHDLRRTFITVAESLDISAYALKRLANHKMSNDITAGYIINDVERLREPMQRISNYFLKSAGIRPSAEIIELFKRNPPQLA
jgi:integrase